MIVLLRADAPSGTEKEVERTLLSHGVASRHHQDPRSGRRAIEATGPGLPLPGAVGEVLRALPGVEGVLGPPDPTPRVSAAPAQVTLAGPRGPVVVGGPEPLLIAGPCSVESEAQLRAVASTVLAAVPSGRAVLRGGAYKPRTSPYAFQGLGAMGLHLLRRIGDELGLPVCSEALDEPSLEEVAATCHLIQIGARTMAAYGLLRAAARCGRPILLKRGFGATIDEWLGAAEHLLSAGAPAVILCERGIRSFEPATRATLDLGGMVAARLRTAIPILIDPSHAAGSRGLVRPLALAGIAAGADGLLVECHPEPCESRSDAAQALSLGELTSLAQAAWAVSRAAQADPLIEDSSAASRGGLARERQGSDHLIPRRALAQRS